MTLQEYGALHWFLKMSQGMVVWKCGHLGSSEWLDHRAQGSEEWEARLDRLDGFVVESSDIMVKS